MDNWLYCDECGHKRKIVPHRIKRIVGYRCETSYLVGYSITYYQCRCGEKHIIEKPVVVDRQII